jgi:tetrahydromethanopterin S-methyltransferase subunit B
MAIDAHPANKGLMNTPLQFFNFFYMFWILLATIYIALFLMTEYKNHRRTSIA